MHQCVAVPIIVTTIALPPTMHREHHYSEKHCALISSLPKYTSFSRPTSNQWCTSISLFQQLKHSLCLTHNTTVYHCSNNCRNPSLTHTMHENVTVPTNVPLQLSTHNAPAAYCTTQVSRILCEYIGWHVKARRKRKGRLPHSLVLSWSWWWRSQWCCCIGLWVHLLATHSLSSVTAIMATLILYVYIKLWTWTNINRDAKPEFFPILVNNLA